MLVLTILCLIPLFFIQQLINLIDLPVFAHHKLDVHHLVGIVYINLDHSLAFCFKLCSYCFVDCVCALVLRFVVLSFNESHTIKLTDWVSHGSWSHLLVWSVFVFAVILVNQPQTIAVWISKLQRCLLLHRTLLVKSHDMTNHIKCDVSCRYFNLYALRGFPKVNLSF